MLAALFLLFALLSILSIPWSWPSSPSPSGSSSCKGRPQGGPCIIGKCRLLVVGRQLTSCLCFLRHVLCVRLLWCVGRGGCFVFEGG